MTEKLTHEEFIKKAIVDLRKDGYKGKYFDNADPIEATNKMAAEGNIVIRPVKGGVMLYFPEDVSATKDIGDEALKKMGLDK